MTRHFREISQENPKTSKMLVGLYTGLLAFIIFALGWQQWVYLQQRDQVSGTLRDMGQLIETLSKRQDRLSDRQDNLKDENVRLHGTLPKEYVTLERYSCDLQDLKKTMGDGFSGLTRRIENLHDPRIRRN